MQNQDEQIESLSKAIESLVVVRSQVAAGVPVNPRRIDDGMQDTGRAFSLLWDLRYNNKGKS